MDAWMNASTTVVIAVQERFSFKRHGGASSLEFAAWACMGCLNRSGPACTPRTRLALPLPAAQLSQGRLLVCRTWRGLMPKAIAERGRRKVFICSNTCGGGGSSTEPFVAARSYFGGFVFFFFSCLALCCSEPDPARPGLEGDVKYYCRKSKPAENCMPPRASGWLKVPSFDANPRKVLAAVIIVVDFPPR